MFASSLSRTYSGATANSARRGSIEDLVPSSQAFLTGSSRPSLGGFGSVPSVKSGGRREARGLENGVVASTVARLKKCCSSEQRLVKLYGSDEVSLVSLVGWVVPGTVDISNVAVDFQFADGSGALQIKLDIPSERQTWLIPRLREILEGSRGTRDSENEDASSCKENLPVFSALHAIRAIGTVRLALREEGPDGVEELEMRAIHIAEAVPAEVAYYHILQAFQVEMNHGELKGNCSLDDKGPMPSPIAFPIDLSDVELPDNCRALTDSTEINVVKYISKYREPDVGVPVATLVKAMKSLGGRLIPRQFSPGQFKRMKARFDFVPDAEDTDDVKQVLADLDEKSVLLLIDEGPHAVVDLYTEAD